MMKWVIAVTNITIYVHVFSFFLHLIFLYIFNAKSCQSFITLYSNQNYHCNKLYRIPWKTIVLCHLLFDAIYMLLFNSNVYLKHVQLLYSYTDNFIPLDMHYFLPVLFNSNVLYFSTFI